MNVEEHRRPMRMPAAGAPSVLGNQKFVPRRRSRPSFNGLVKDDFSGEHFWWSRPAPSTRRRSYRTGSPTAFVVLDKGERRDVVWRSSSARRPRICEHDQDRADGGSEQCGETSVGAANFSYPTRGRGARRARLFLHRDGDKSTPKPGLPGETVKARRWPASGSPRAAEAARTGRSIAAGSRDARASREIQRTIVGR